MQYQVLFHCGPNFDLSARLRRTKAGRWETGHMGDQSSPGSLKLGNKLQEHLARYSAEIDRNDPEQVEASTELSSLRRS